MTWSRHIQPGTMRHSGLPGKTGIGFGETIFAPRARALFTDPPAVTSGDANQPTHAREKTSVTLSCILITSVLLVIGLSVPYSPRNLGRLWLMP